MPTKKKESKSKAGRISAADLRSMINQNAGSELAHDLTTKNPSEVSEWIPTGSRWLDGIICRGKLAGIPMGRITEIAGLQARLKELEEHSATLIDPAKTDTDCDGNKRPGAN